MEFEIKTLSKEDRSKVRDFLEKHYYPDDPLLQALEVTTIDERHHERVLSVLGEGYSYAAVSSEDTILGVLIIAVTKLEGTSQLREQVQRIASETEYFSKFLKVCLQIAEGSRLFEIGNCDKFLSFRYAAVSSEHRRHGIMKKLFLRGIKTAQENGYAMVSCPCASQFTTNLCKSLGWDCGYALPYICFEDENGERLFKKPVYPHLHLRMYVANV